MIVDTGFVWRSVSVGDAEAMADLNAAVREADGVGDIRSATEMAAVFKDDGRPVPPAFFGVFAGECLAALGALVARRRPAPEHRMQFWGMVHPDFRRRGLGTELVSLAIREAPELHARTTFSHSPLELAMDLYDDVPGHSQLAADTGFEIWRSSYEMIRDLPWDPADLSGPLSGSATGRLDDGLEIVGFDQRYVDELRDAHIAAFVLDHPGATCPTPELWRRRFTNATFRPDLSCFVRDRQTHTIAGYLLANHSEEDAWASGKRDVHLMTIATRREYRRRGVAGSLIHTALTEAVKQGFDTASLDVDAENPTGAVRVYERAGFRVLHKCSAYIRKICA